MEAPNPVPSTAAPQEGLSKLAASTFLTAVVNIAVPVTMSLLTQPPAQSVSAALPSGPRPFLSRELSDRLMPAVRSQGFSQAPTPPIVHDTRFISQLDS